MQPEAKLTGKDVRVLALWLLAGVIGAAVAYQYFFAAFPEASVDFRVTREEAMGRGRGLLGELGEDVSEYQSSVVFEVDQNAKTYLERELDLRLANQLMAGEVNVWWWDVRFFRPQQQEELRIEVDPSGRVVGMRHVIPEARAGAKLEAEAARTVADEFLRERLQFDFARYEYLSGETNAFERPNRRDWSFTWERRVSVLEQAGKDAPYRVRVTVQGDRAGGFEEFLRVPEAWQREFERLRSSNTLFQVLAQVPYAILMGAVFLVVFDMTRKGQVNWRGALNLGLVLGALFFVMNVNEWPITRHAYDTNSDYTGFLVQSLALAALASLLLAVLVTLSVAAGEPLYRGDHPEKLRLGAAFSRGTWREGVRSKEFFKACVIGLAMAAAHIGFVVAFYLLGKNVGFWAPQEIQYTEAVSTALPWIYPLAISLFAATSEEFLFRLFAIPLLLRVTKSKWIAVIVPALVWGFLHSAYPQQPGWVRGVEVGVIGVVAGWVMLRWGILATLVWHYTVDALLIGLFLLRSESFYFQFSGWFVVALTLFPLAFATVAYVARGKFAAGEELFNRAAPVGRRLMGEEETEEVGARPGEDVAAGAGATASAAAAPSLAQPLGAGMRWLLVGLAAAGMAAVIAVRPARVGDDVRFSINRGEAQERAARVLEQRGVEVSEWRRAAIVVDTFDGTRLEYLRRQMGLERTRELVRERVPSVFWRVRFFRDSQREEYGVVLRPDGALHAVHHQLEEAAPGASLTKEEAQARAEAWLLQAKMLDFSRWRLVEAESDKKPKRVDHTFTWEEIAPIGAAPQASDAGVGQEQSQQDTQGRQDTFASLSAGAGDTGTAHVRAQVRVQGEEVSGYRVFVKIPEEWEREHNQRTLGWIAYQVCRALFVLAWVIVILAVFFRHLKEVRVPWARLSRWALWGAVALLVSVANSIPQLMSAYPTEYTLKLFLALIVITQFFVVGLAYSGIFLLFGFGWFLLTRSFGEGRLPGWRAPGGDGAWYYRDAVLLALGGAGALALYGRLMAQVDRIWPTAKANVMAASYEALQPQLPVVAGVAGAVLAGLFLAGLVAVAAGSFAWLGRVMKSESAARGPQAGLLVVMVLVMIGSWGGPADYAKQAILQVALLALIVWGVARVLRFNLLAYFLLAGVGTLASFAGELLQHTDGFVRWNGYGAAAAAVAFVVWPLVAWWRASGGTRRDGSPAV
ncbi:MAG: CPBP family intramembrane glutamic endopeptidase [Candidatus Acidiferrales bacterium]